MASPDENIQIEVVLAERVYYSVKYKIDRVLDHSPVSMTLSDKVLGKDPVITDVRERSVDEKIRTVWGSRNVIQDLYNELTLSFEGDFSIEFRAYNKGVAYRFVTNVKDKQVTVWDEEVCYRFGFHTSAWMLNAQSYESNFEYSALDAQSLLEFNNEKEKVYLPVIVQPNSRVKIAITEANLHDYPSLFLNRSTDFENYLTGSFEKVALTKKQGAFSNYSMVADQEADYIALTEGKRNFPWRLMIISDDDRTFADCDLVYQLSKPCVLKETDWIRPGQVAWEWWHDYVVEGQQFRGGVNTQTYMYHADFAAKYGIEYIIIDWMWADKHDLTLVNPDVDIRKVINYANGKGVNVILWCPGHTLHRQLEKALDLFADYGASGVKVDFFGGEDQTANRMYEDIAKSAAKHKMLVDFHGCAKPTGLSRTYPNIINYEAVLGNEWNKMDDICTMDHKLIVPFTRMLLGPMDFTPGGMRNVQGGHKIRFTLPMVHGSRSNEMALFVLYNEPLKMLCDAPSVYDREPEITRFITGIPTVWDNTHVLEASFGEYLVTARNKGNDWYVAGITGETPKELSIDLSFLDNGTYTAKILHDGPNSDRVGTDYLFEEKEINRNSKLLVKMVAGGGFVIRLQRNP